MAIALYEDIPEEFYLLFACSKCVKALGLTPILSAAYDHSDLLCTVCGSMSKGSLVVETDGEVYERRAYLLKL